MSPVCSGLHKQGTVSALLPFQPVTNVVIGCDDIAQLGQNVKFASSFEPMPQEQQDLIRDVSPFARQLMYYKQ